MGNMVEGELRKERKGQEGEIWRASGTSSEHGLSVALDITSIWSFRDEKKGWEKGRKEGRGAYYRKGGVMLRDVTGKAQDL